MYESYIENIEAKETLKAITAASFHRRKEDKQKKIISTLEKMANPVAIELPKVESTKDLFELTKRAMSGRR